MEKKIIYLNATVNAVSLILIAIITFLYVSLNNKVESLLEPDVSKLPKRSKALGGLEYGDAEKMVNSYRNQFSFRKLTHGFWHTPNEMGNYISDTLIKYTDQVPLYGGKEWVMGFCPMYVDENGKARLVTCFVPTIVHTESKYVYDYFESRNAKDSIYSAYYQKLEEIMTATGKFKSPVFDEGQLWP